MSSVVCVYSCTCSAKFECWNGYRLESLRRLSCLGDGFSTRRPTLCTSFQDLRLRAYSSSHISLASSTRTSLFPNASLLVSSLSLIFSPSTLSHLSSTPQSFFPVFPPFHLLPLVLSYFSTLLQMVKRVRMEYCKRGTESQQSRDAVEGVVRSFETRIGAERATVQTGSSIL